MKQNTGKALKIASIFGCAILAMVVAIGGYVHRLNTLLERDSEAFLVEVTSQGRTIIQEKLESDFVLLNSFAGGLSRFEDLQSPDVAALLAQQVQMMPEGARLLAATLDGVTVDSDGRGGTIDPALIAQVLANGETVSDLQPTALAPDQNMIALTVPIERDGRAVGVLSCRYNTAQYGDLVEFTLYQGEGRAVILKPNGETVVRRKNDPALPDWAWWETAEWEEVLSQIQQGESGVIRCKDQQNGRDLFLSLLPLEVNDWYLLVVVPGSLILKSKQAIASAVMVAGVVTALVMAAIVCFFLRLDRRQKQTVKNLSLYDRLTRIPNLQSIQQFYDRQLLKERDYAFLLLRINFFEQINNSFGFAVGGEILKEVSKVLQDALQEGEFTARISENYFAVLIRRPGTESALSNRVDRLFAQLERVPVADGAIEYDYRCTYTGGVYLLREETEAFSEVFRKADLVIGSLPETRKTNWGVFGQKMEQALVLQNALTLDVLGALKGRQFIPYFQPLFDQNTQEIIGAEVLARWDHPTQGLLLPGQFLPVLELAGCILELDLQMLEGACYQLKAWLDQGLLPVPLSVNISRLNLHRKDFLPRVLHIVQKYQVPTNLLALELSESAVAENSDKTLQLAKTLKSHGFLLSVDNFGTASSSLDLLRELPVDLIKLGRGFLQNWEVEQNRGRAILSGVRNIAHGLQAILVAEGVETQDQADFVRESGVAYVQGFLYGAPMSDAELRKLIFSEQ